MGRYLSPLPSPKTSSELPATHHGEVWWLWDACALPHPLLPEPVSLFAFKKKTLCFGFSFFLFLFLFKAVVNKLTQQVGGEAGLKSYSWEKVSVIGFGSQNGFMLPDTKPSSMH